MTITRNLQLIVGDDSSNLSVPLSFYQNDRGIDLYFSIDSYAYDFSGDMLNSLDNATVSVIIKKPNGTSYRTPKASIENSQVKFTITQEITDEISEIGIYELQFQFYDNVAGRISIPPFEFRVKELISPVDDDPMLNAQVEFSAIDNTRITARTDLSQIIKKWKAGDIINAASMNYIMDSLDTVKFGTYKQRPTDPAPYQKFFDTTIGEELIYIDGHWYDNQGFISDVNDLVGPDITA